MKRIGLCIALACVVALSMSSVSWGGLCLDSDSACNDMYYAFEKLQTGPGVFQLHGYEYGCGYNDRLSDGVIVVTGGYAYAGVTVQLGTSGGGDYGGVSNRNYVINLSSDTGSYHYNVFGISAGVTGWGGGPSNATLRRSCSPSFTGEMGLEADELAGD